MADTEYSLVDSETRYDDFLNTLSRSEILALDTEFERRNTFFPKPALLQIHAAGSTYLIDPLAIPDLDSLFQLLSEETVVMHACREDLEVFRELSRFRLGEMFDTQIAASMLGADSQMSYQNLVELKLGEFLPKSETRSDWLQRPLSQKQLQYAADDVLYLEDLHKLLEAELRQNGRFHWFVEEMSVLNELKEAPSPEDYIFRLKGIGRFNPGQLSFVYDLSLWRENEARKRNMPRGFILKDKALLLLARQYGGKASVTNQELSRVEGVSPGFIRRYQQKITQILQSPIDNEEKQVALERIGFELPFESKGLKQEIKVFRDMRAKDLGLKPEFLLSNRLIDELLFLIYFTDSKTGSQVKQGAFEKILRPWRYEQFREFLRRAEQ